jgi:hypothetical protein
VLFEGVGADDEAGVPIEGDREPAGRLKIKHEPAIERAMRATFGILRPRRTL